MALPAFRRGWLVLLGFAILVAGCDEVPTAPSPVGDASPQSRTMTRLEISGAASIPPGETVRYVARAIYSDGAWEDVTTRVAWLSSDPSVLTVSADGTASGRNRGEAVVSASLAGLVATKSAVFVVADGDVSAVGHRDGRRRWRLRC